MDKTMLKSMACQKPYTSKPFITLDAKRIKPAFITKVNKPSVKILIGKVSIINIGFNTTLITPRNKASQSAAQNPLTIIPGKI